MGTETNDGRGGSGVGKSLLSGSLGFKDGDSSGISPPPKILQKCGKERRERGDGGPPSARLLANNRGLITIVRVELTFVGCLLRTRPCDEQNT